MTNSLALNRTSFKTKTRATFLAVLAAVALPQVFHVVGVASGLGSSLGAAFLPMHLPVFLAGFMFGPIVGLLAGVASPLLSYALTGMPSAVMLPNMVAELAGYGLVAGLLYNVKMPVIGKLLIAQIAGHILKALVILLSVNVLGNTGVPTALIWSSVVTGLPGVLLQWSLIPLIMFWANNRNNRHE